MSYLIEPPSLLFALLIICFLTALVHSSVGLGGGSSYIAWMVIFSVPTLLVPVLALSLNVVVSSIGVFQFSRKGLMPWKTLLVILCFSMPFAYLGGSLNVSNEVLRWILLLSLFSIFLRLCFYRDDIKPISLSRLHIFIVLVLLSVSLGFLSGVVGIGGGIYLVPMLVILKVLDIKQAAACGSAFILFNSMVALLSKSQFLELDVDKIIPFLLVVLVGGLLGSSLAIRNNRSFLQHILKYVVLLACVLLFKRLVF